MNFTNNGISLSNENPLEKERNQILWQTKNTIENQNKIISEQSKQIKMLTETVIKSANEAEKSAQNSKKSAKFSLILSCCVGIISAVALVIEILKYCAGQ